MVDRLCVGVMMSGGSATYGIRCILLCLYLWTPFYSSPLAMHFDRTHPDPVRITDLLL